MPTNHRIAAGRRIFTMTGLKGRRNRFSIIAILSFFLLFFVAPDDISAQSGGRKREPKAKKRGNVVLRQYKSRGHADEFAKGNSGRRGRLSRLFRKDRPAWQYRKSGSARSNQKENRFLFGWNRTKGKQENVQKLERQNRERAKNRERGNNVFKSRKHKRKK